MIPAKRLRFNPQEKIFFGRPRSTDEELAFPRLFLVRRLLSFRSLPGKRGGGGGRTRVLEHDFTYLYKFS